MVFQNLWMESRGELARLGTRDSSRASVLGGGSTWRSQFCFPSSWTGSNSHPPPGIQRRAKGFLQRRIVADQKAAHQQIPNVQRGFLPGRVTTVERTPHPHSLWQHSPFSAGPILYLLEAQNLWVIFQPDAQGRHRRGFHYKRNGPPPGFQDAPSSTLRLAEKLARTLPPHCAKAKTKRKVEGF